MRRFEMVEGTSSKFWEVETSGVDVTVRFGRIGTDGQTKTKTFDDVSKAAAEEAKLIKEKTGKGYAEVAATGALAKSATAPAAAPTTKPASVTTKTAAKTAAKTATPTSTAAPTTTPIPATPAASDAITATPLSTRGISATSLLTPSGGYVFSKADISLLPTFRGVHVRPFSPELSLFGDWADQLQKKISKGDMRKQLDWLASFGYHLELQAFTKDFAAAATLWKGPDVAAKLDRAVLLKCSAEDWRDVFLHSFFAFSDHYRVGASRRAVHICLALRGLAFTMEVVLPVWQTLIIDTQDTDHFDAENTVHVLRAAVAVASDDECAKAEAVAMEHLSTDDFKNGILSYIFAHVPAIASRCVDSKDHRICILIQNSALSFDEALRLAKAGKVRMWHYEDRFKPTPLLWIKRLGDEQALTAITPMLEHVDNSMRAALSKMLVRIRVPSTLDTMIAHILNKEVRPNLEPLVTEFPAEAMRAAFEQAAQSRNKDLESWAVRFATSHMEQVDAALAALSPAVRERAESLIKATQREAAPDDALPSILRSPPWLDKRKPQEVLLIDLEPMAVAAKTTLSAVELASFKSHFGTDSSAQRYFEENWKRRYRKGTEPSADEKKQALNFHLLKQMHFAPGSYQKVLNGEPFDSSDFADYYSVIECVISFPDAIALHIWNLMPAGRWYFWNAEGTLQALLGKFEMRALPGFINLLKSKPQKEIVEFMRHIDAIELAPQMAYTAYKSKRIRSLALAWFRKFALTGALGLLPIALSKTSKDKALRDATQFVIRWMSANGLVSALNDAAKQYGSDCEASLASLLAIDPLSIVPSKLPKLPSWFTPGAYSRPELHDGRPLSVAACEHIGTMIAISDMDDPYGGIEIVKEHCTAVSLAEFAWNTFQSWGAAGYTSKENWGFTALALFGTDETARRLAPLIREWPGQAAHARAVMGLDILAMIGTDVSLMHLNAIADKAKFKGLQERAKEKIQVIADNRGLTRDELADRLVPDLGLDEAGALQLDFGPRQFTVAFDESLKPYVMDEQRTRLKDLPKPIKSDDEAKADAATERYKALKKDAKAIASQQIKRLELAMVNARRWPVADFNLFFIEHPLMRFLAQRLAWAVYVDGQAQSVFRIAEDLTFADHRDESYTLPDSETVSVGIAHVLDMQTDTTRAIGEIFADYNILQPFKQLSRETYQLTDAEKATSEITRFATKTVATVSLMGLNARGWERSGAEDGGWVGEFRKPLPEGLEVVLSMDPGTVIGDPTYEPIQKIPSLTLRKSNTWGKDGLVKYEHLSPMLASEILRDVDLLAIAVKE
jgi:predicted DNA-binding WGR domain protein/cellobiose-specific phosphotransferase system component IIB